MSLVPDENLNVQPAESKALVEHFFRHQYANLISVLTRAFGFSRIDQIEDTVQSAMLSAMNSWKFKGVPKNPAGWIHRVARNRMLDVLRREKTHQTALAWVGASAEMTESLVDQWLDDREISDSLLRMMFACCHPLLDRDSQIALTLKILCGFSIDEIARGLLKNHEAIKKKIQRAKKKLADNAVSLEFPTDDQQKNRLGVVHDTLYLLFNEGYSTSQGSDPIRDDICEEAARLCHILCRHSELSTPESKALMALMLFHASRFEARIDERGGVVLLSDQDRRLWDRNLIQMAELWLSRSKSPRPSRFHYEAAIAQQHCRAKDLDSTSWPTIIQLYNRLLLLNDSGVYRLNRAIALAMNGEIQRAQDEVEGAKSMLENISYPILDCVSGAIHELAGDFRSAIDDYLRALSKTEVPHEKELIEKKLAGIQEKLT